MVNQRISDIKYKEIIELVPIVCVDLLVFRENKNGVLVCKRNNEPEKGKYGLPGGRILWGESLDDAVRRKAKEELGIEVEIKYQYCTFDYRDRVRHSIGIVYVVTCEDDVLIKLDSQHSKFRWANQTDNTMAEYAQKVIGDFLW